MRRRIPGLSELASASLQDVPDGKYLVRVEKAEYHHWPRPRPFYLLRFLILKPQQYAGHIITGRLLCTPKSEWKLGWFLIDFGFDRQLIAKDEVDDKVLIGLRGVVKISHRTIHGIEVINFDGFAPARRWDELSSTTVRRPRNPEIL